MDLVLLNTLTLQALIKHQRSELKPYHILSLDLRKAFDTVSQSLVEREMKRFGVEGRMRSLVMDGYFQSSTKTRAYSTETREIQLLRGVKQGDPMSPILFNIVLDELICDLESRGEGLVLSEHLKVSVLGYVDDLILVSETSRNASKLLQQANEFFEARGMSLNVDKSCALSVNVSRGQKEPQERDTEDSKCTPQAATEAADATDLSHTSIP